MALFQKVSEMWNLVKECNYDNANHSCDGILQIMKSSGQPINHLFPEKMKCVKKITFVLTSLADLGALTCKLVNFVDQSLKSFRSP